MTSPSKRKEGDVTKLMMKDFIVEPIDDKFDMFTVKFHGPKDSMYEGGVWKVRVELPDDYPYESPAIAFVNKIYHPNIDGKDGVVCLNVLNQDWTPMSDLLNVFETFLPQLLLYPNPKDPLNYDAAGLMNDSKEKFAEKVKEYCERYAKNTETKSEESNDEDDDDDDDSSDKEVNEEPKESSAAAAADVHAAGVSNPQINP